MYPFLHANFTRIAARYTAIIWLWLLFPIFTGIKSRKSNSRDQEDVGSSIVSSLIFYLPMLSFVENLLTKLCFHLT